jgi:hypothetical protein
MRFSFDFEQNQFALPIRFWRKPRVMIFLNSPIRKEVSTYPNYLRIVWWYWDICLQWGSKLKEKKTS